MDPIQVTISLRAVIAFFGGAMIGYTRIRSQRPAGIRTQALICSGSALMSSLSVAMGTVGGVAVADPTRIMAQVVTGIGFLGGGVIVKNNDRLKGVTTAAMIWFTAGVGMLIGVGYFVPALVALGLILLAEVIGQLEFRFGIKTKPYLLTLRRQDAPQLRRLMKFFPQDTKGQLVNGKKFSLYFSSSEQKNQQIRLFLRHQRIPYSLTKQSSLKESTEVFNEFV